MSSEKHGLFFTVILLFYASAFCKVYKDLKAGPQEGPVLGTLAFAMKELPAPGFLRQCSQLSKQPSQLCDRSWRAQYRLQARAVTYSQKLD